MPLALRVALGAHIAVISSFERVLEMATESWAADIATAQRARNAAGFFTIGRALRSKNDKTDYE
jgi:hypothetical protein